MLPSFVHMLSSHKVITVKFTVVIAAALVGFYVLNQNVVLTPYITSVYEPGSRSMAIHPSASKTLIHTADQNMPWLLTADRFPFTVTIPRVVKAVRVQGTAIPGTQPYVTFVAEGAKGDAWTHIVSSAFLDTLPWKRVESEGISLWMKDSSPTEPIQQFASVEDFRANPPDLGMVGTAGVDPLAFVRGEQYQPQTRVVQLPHTFRGSHTLYTLARQEDVQLTFNKIDLNRKPGKDELTVRIIRADKYRDDDHTWLASVSVKDDGNANGNGKSGPAQLVELTLPNVAPGVYRVEIVTSEDVLFNNVTSAQQMFSFSGKVWLADGPAYGQADFPPVQIATNAGWITLSPSHAQGKQVVQVGDKRVTLEEVKKTQLVSGLKGETKVMLLKGELTIASDALLAFAPAVLLPVKGTAQIDLSTEVSLEHLQYIVVPYTPRTTGEITFDHTYPMEALQLRGKELSFVLNAAGLDANEKTLGLEKLQVTFIRGAFPWAQLWSKVQNSLHFQ